MVMKPGDIVVGSRIESDGQHATVKYIGQVPPTKGNLVIDVLYVWQFKVLALL